MNLKQRMLDELDFLCLVDKEKLNEIVLQFETYKKLLKEFNSVHNLCHFNDIDTQIIDSLKILDFENFFTKFASLNENVKICDIGSGAGFAALFWALFSKASFYLFEPNAKKAAFLRSVKIALSLENVHIIKEKVQDFKSEFRAQIISSRALMRVKNLLEICSHLNGENTEFIFYKGSALQEELTEAHGRFKNLRIYEYDLRKYCVLNAL